MRLLNPKLLAGSVALVAAACTATAPPSQGAQRCAQVGDRVVSELDWASSGTAVALLMSSRDGAYSVARLERATLELVELGHGFDIVPSGVTMDQAGAVFWQQTLDGASMLRRKGRDGGTQDWLLPRSGVASLESTTTTLLATEVTVIAQEANVVDIVELDLKSSGAADSRVLATRVGIQSFSATSDGATVATAAQEEIAGDLLVSVSGNATWSASVQNALPGHVAIAPDGRAVMFRDSATLEAKLLGADGTVGSSRVGAVEVLAFDIAPDGAIAFGNANITGGDGRVCLVEP